MPPLEASHDILLDPTWVFRDSRSHSYGITAVLTLGITRFVDNPNNPDLPKEGTPILTGCYDDHLRLFMYEPVLRRKKLLQDVPIGGAVWRIELMDEYNEVIGPFPTQGDDSYYNPALDVTTTDDESKFTGQNIERRHFILLVDCYLAGVKIVRLTHIIKYHLLPDSYLGYRDLVASQGYKTEIVAHFHKGHESMVYGIDFRKDLKQARELGFLGYDGGHGDKKFWTGAYTIVSCSWYDNAVCVWKWQDSVFRGIVMVELREWNMHNDEGDDVASFVTSASDDFADTADVASATPSQEGNRTSMSKGRQKGTGTGILGVLKRLTTAKVRNKNKLTPLRSTTPKEAQIVASQEKKGLGGLLARAKSVSARGPHLGVQSADVAAKRRSLAL